MLVQAGRETKLISSALRRVRDRLSARIDVNFYRQHLMVKELCGRCSF